MRHFTVLIFLLLSLIQLAQAATAPKTRPKICVVLSGGGARGFAHVGMLRYLEEHHIPVDCIAGTSMGAVIGGLYASGMSVDDIEQHVKQINLGQVALDIVDRRKLNQSLREDDTNYPIEAVFGINQNGISLPLGAIQTNQFLQLLHNWTANIPPDISFDQLPIPFRAVATDLETGEMVIFDKGPLHNAIHASMAAPGVFAPVEINGRLLADGGLVRNLPVDVARGMGADIIIASNIGTSLLPRADLKSFFNISQQMLSILTEQNVNTQISSLLPTDILINPDLNEFGFMDFPREAEITAVGYRTTQASSARFKALELDEATYLAQFKARPESNLSPVQIAFVDVHSTGKIPAEDIRRELGIPVGGLYDSQTINQQIAPLIETRQFDSVTHTLVRRGNQYGVEIDAVEKSWGPNFIRLGLEMMTGLNGQGGFELQVGHRLPWLTDSGLEWRNDLEIGNIYGLRSELRQPLWNREGSYLAPFVDLQQKTLNIYSNSNNNNPIADYHMQTVQAGLDLGVPVGHYGELGELRTGLLASHYNLHPQLGALVTPLSTGNMLVSSLPYVKMTEYAFHAKVSVDQLDTPVFPRDGYLFGAELLAGVNQNETNSTVLDTHAALRNFQQLTLNGSLAFSRNEHSVNLSMALGDRLQSGSAIPGVGLALGGFEHLSAYQPEQFIGNHLFYSNVTYLYRALNYGLFSEAAFLGTSLEMGNAANRRSDFSMVNLKKSVSIFVGATTFMGPVHVGIAVAPAGEFNLFLQLGRQ